MQYRWYILAGLLLLIYGGNLFIDVMNVDAAQYANISHQMYQSGSYLEVYLNGQDYLDKPPLLFWLASLSFHIFGVHNFSYKLPALLLILLGIYSTYRYTAFWYDQEKAKIAALILASTMAFYLITNDVRMDGMLTGFVITAIWQLCRYVENGAWKHLLWGAICTAGAMMTKGPLGIVIVGVGLGADFLMKRDWKTIFKWQWLVFLAIVGILLLPMCYGLYQQFDLHPEKQVYGLDGPSGLRFFFWTQSFGRITGEIYWSNDTGPFYFIQTLLWDFQPWFLIGFMALGYKIWRMFHHRLQHEREYISLFGFVLLFLALSKSNYKLPHYVFPLLPFLSVMCADFLLEFVDNKRRFGKILLGYQFILAHLLFIAIGLLLTMIFPTKNPILYIILLAFLSFYYLFYFRLESITSRLIHSTAISSIALGFFMSIYFYPNLLQFQSGSQVGQRIADLGIPKEQFYTTNASSQALDFYSAYHVDSITLEELAACTNCLYVICKNEDLAAITKMTNGQYEVLETYDEYKVTRLTSKFLNAQTRATQLEKTYFLKRKNQVQGYKTSQNTEQVQGVNH